MPERAIDEMEVMTIPCGAFQSGNLSIKIQTAAFFGSLTLA